MEQQDTMQRYGTMLMAASMAIVLFVATQAVAAPAEGLAARHAGWAGGYHNAESLVSGLRNGTSVTLVTQSGDHKSIAGFTPPGRLTNDEIAAALANAERTLSGMGIRRPSAEQMQAALIGGEVTLPGGRTRLVQGSLAAPGAEAPRVAVAR
jgi:hypothetical protein